MTAPGLDRVTVHRQGTDFEACCPCCEEGPELDRLRSENARLREAAAEVLAEFDALDREAQEQPGCGGLPETGGIVLLRAALGGGA